MNTPKRQNPEGKVVAWQRRGNWGNGWSAWCDCSEQEFNNKKSIPGYYDDCNEVEYRELIPATTLTAMQRRLEEQAECMDNLAGVIRQYGTCAPSALEVVANRLRTLLLRDGKGDGEVDALSGMFPEVQEHLSKLTVKPNSAGETK